MGCGATKGGSSGDPQTKGREVENAVGVVPVPGQTTKGDGGSSVDADGDAGHANGVKRSDDCGSPDSPAIEAGKKEGQEPVMKGTVRRLYNPMRLACPFDDDDTEERSVLWNLLRGQTVVEPAGPPLQTPVEVAHTGKPIDIACDFGTVRLRINEAEAQEIVERPPEVIAEPLDLSALRPARMLQARSRRASVAGVSVRHVTGHCRAVKAVGLSGDGRLLVSGDGIDARQALRCLDVRSCSHVGTLNGYRGGSGEAPCDLSFSTNGQQLATCDQSDTLLLWDMTTFRCKKTLQFEGEDGNELFLVGVRLSPDGRLVAAAAEQSDEEGVSRGRVVIWDLEAKQQKLMFSEHTASVLCHSFSPCSTLLASGGRDGQLYIWKAETGMVVHKLPGHLSGVRSCQFNHDGSVLLTNDAKVLCLWETASGKPCLTRHIDGSPRPNTLPEHAKPDTDVQPSKTRYMVSLFIPGGLMLVAASDKQVRLFNARTGVEQYSIGTRAPVTCASSANSTVALGDVYGNVYVAELTLRATEQRLEDCPVLPDLPVPPEAEDVAEAKKQQVEPATAAAGGAADAAPIPDSQTPVEPLTKDDPADDRQPAGQEADKAKTTDV
eukprot:TRINITY_DN8962_c0_g1_i1.p1 TRINITY_DN8962_c0_g1~~TRINITY_DN8962_c0_g1_i1.p1  ORF type:complete len:636 (+),score=124.81 TRINITY_DN8962_c0_g1_i1:90-1910(+)